MVIAIVVAHAYSVLQLIILGSLTRTVRIRTVYAAMAVGLYLCVPLTVVLQIGWIHALAPLLGMSEPQLVNTASYTLDPFLEEGMKALPLILLLMNRTYRAQWAFTDLVLIAAATGTGFGLGEDLYRFAGSADRAHPLPGGWALMFSQANAFVPGIGRILTSWLPDGVTPSDSHARLDMHLVWSALVGLAVGLMLLRRTRGARLTALALFVGVGLDHAAGNATGVEASWAMYLSKVHNARAHVHFLMPIIAVAVAWYLDQKRQQGPADIAPWLRLERGSTPAWRGTFGAALIRPPWSLASIDRFVRMRRAYRTELAAHRNCSSLRALIDTERDRVDAELAHLTTARPALWPAAWTMQSVRAAIKRPAVILWLLMTAPPALWFVVGGWPQTAKLQTLLLQPGTWRVLFPLSVLAQIWILWQTLLALRAWSRLRKDSTGDEAALVGLRIACGLGAVSLGAFSLLKMLAGAVPGSSLLAGLHAAEAADSQSPAGGSLLAGSFGALTPPAQSRDRNASSADNPGDVSENPAEPSDTPNASEPAGGAPHGRSEPSQNASGPAAVPADEGGADPLDPLLHDPQLPTGGALLNQFGAFDPAPPTIELPDSSTPPSEGPAAAGNASAAPGMTSIGEGPATAAEPSDLPPLELERPSKSPPAANSAPQSTLGAYDPPPPTLELPDNSPATPAESPPGTGNSNADGAVPPSAPARGASPTPPAPAQDADPGADANSADSPEAADADVARAQEGRRDAQNASESSQIKQAGDVGGDPAVAQARDQVRAAHDAEDAASVANASDFNDPWDEKNPSQLDRAHAASRSAEADRDNAEAAAAQRMQDDVDRAKAAETQADSDLAAAQDKAARAHADAPAQAEANAAAQRRIDDPKGAAADQAAKAAADAQREADKAFFDDTDKSGDRYRAARENAERARQQAEAAQAAADAGKSSQGTHARNSSRRKPGDT